jgi:hypothetical protein
MPDQFGQVPVQILHEDNSVVHVSEFDFLRVRPSPNAGSNCRVNRCSGCLLNRHNAFRWTRSPAARLAQHAARMTAAMDAAVDALIVAVPTLTPESATAALEVAVPIPVRGAARFLEELTTHLASHPDALASGEPLCPPTLMRLTYVLHDSGHPVTRIACAHCGRHTTELRQLLAARAAEQSENWTKTGEIVPGWDISPPPG